MSRLSRRRAIGTRRRSIGDATFDQLNQIPEFSQAWSSIQTQMQTEHAGPLDLAAAQNDLASAFDSLTSSAQGFGLSASDALEAAKQYTIAGRTVLGAVQHVQGLLQAAQGADPTQAFEMFTGTLIGAAAAAGAFSAGIGSVIVAGIGVALDLLDSAGLFGTPPKGTEICSGLYLSPAPTIQVGCVGTWAQPIAVSSPHWRQYPKRSGGHTNDSLWYTSGSAQWSGSATGTLDTWTSYPAYRLIDSAFPEAHYLACAPAPAASLGDFHTAFLSAWTANQEYALNGLKPQPDWQVLLHLLRIWNRSHTASSSVALSPVAKPTIAEPTIAQIQAGQAPCPSIPSYELTLINDLIDNLAANDPILIGGQIRVNTGPVVAPSPATSAPKVIHLTLKPAPAAPVSTKAPAPTVWSASPTSATTGTTAAIATGAALVGAAALYVHLRGVPAFVRRLRR